jgi:hypothetical protein
MTGCQQSTNHQHTAVCEEKEEQNPVKTTEETIHYARALSRAIITNLANGDVEDAHTLMTLLDDVLQGREEEQVAPEGLG